MIFSISFFFGELIKKDKKKEKQMHCVIFVTNSIWEEIRSRIVQLQGVSRNYSTSFVAIRFDFVFKESLLVTSSSYLFKQDANLSLAVLPYVDSIG